jgi:hypothetical protein
MIRVLIAVSITLGIFTLTANAQRRFAGTYDLGSGYESGPGKGTFSYGVATVARDGTAAYTLYSPANSPEEQNNSGSGKINNKGVFSFNNDVSGVVRLVSTTIDAIGDFTDSFGSGFFGLTKK